VCKTGERDNNVGVVENEASVEIGEAEEGLNIPDFLWLRPILYGLNLRLVHGESLGDVPTVLLDGKNTQSDRREVNRTVLSG